MVLDQFYRNNYMDNILVPKVKLNQVLGNKIILKVDSKNLTIKFDYDPVINSKTFGLGVNF